jgi:hypothetical protein
MNSCAVDHRKLSKAAMRRYDDLLQESSCVMKIRRGEEDGKVEVRRLDDPPKVD